MWSHTFNFAVAFYVKLKKQKQTNKNHHQNLCEWVHCLCFLLEVLWFWSLHWCLNPFNLCVWFKKEFWVPFLPCDCPLFPAAFFFSFIFISWRLITLQYCNGFCHTLTWISHGFTCVPHPDPPSHLLSMPSLWVFPVHQPWAPISCIQPGLVICFNLDSILVSMLFSQNIPPSPSPRVQKSVLYICVFFCFAYRVIITIFLNSIYMH